MEIDKRKFYHKLLAFSWKIYQLVPEEHKKNVVFSPYGIQVILAIAYSKSSGKTAAEIAAALDIPGVPPEVLTEFFDDSLTYLHFEVNSLNVLNQVYIREDLEPSADFNKMIELNFRSEVTQIQFDDISEAILEIDDWYFKKTKERIQDIVYYETIEKTTQLLLVNAIHLKAKWRYIWYPHETMEFPFWLNETRSVIVETMTTWANYKTAELPEIDAKVLRLKYLKNKLAMLVIVPNKRDGLDEMLPKIQDLDLDGVFSRMKKAYYSLRLPKFKNRTMFEMHPILKGLGINTIFEDEAEISGIVEPEVSPLKVQRIIHKAWIQVIEEGTEEMVCYYNFKDEGTHDEILNFHVEHPFAFLIVTTGEIKIPIYFGTVSDPRKIPNETFEINMY